MSVRKLRLHFSMGTRTVLPSLCFFAVLGMSILKCDVSKAVELNLSDVAKSTSKNKDNTQPATKLITVTGRVMGEKIPLENADVRVRLMRHDARLSEPVKIWRLKSDSNGNYRFEIRQLAGTIGKFFLEIDIAADGFADFRKTVYRLVIRKGNTLSLPQSLLFLGRIIEGRCIGADSKPAVGAVIRCIGSTGSRIPWRSRRRLTDKKGRFELTIPKDADAEFLVLSRSHLPRRVSVSVDKDKLGDIILEPGTQTTGRLFSEDGKPISGCVVAFESSERGNLPGGGFSLKYAAKTNGEGKFAIPPIRGQYQVWLAPAHASLDREHLYLTGISPPAFLPLVLEFDGKSKRDIILRCSTEAKVSGTIYMPDGKPAVGVEVSIHAALGDGRLGAANFVRQITTDMQGKYSFAGLPRGLPKVYLVIPPTKLPDGRLSNVKPFGKVSAQCRFQAQILTIGDLDENIQHLDFQYERPVPRERQKPIAQIKQIDQGLAILGKEFELKHKEWEETLGLDGDPTYLNNPRHTMAFRFVEFAEKHPDDSVAISALLHIFQIARVTGDPESPAVKAMERGIKLVSKRLIDHPDIMVLFFNLKSRVCSKEAEALLRRALSKSPHRDVRGAACFHLAFLLRNKASLPAKVHALKKINIDNTPAVFKPTRRRILISAEQAAVGLDSVKLLKESRQLFERVTEEFSDVMYLFRCEGPADVSCRRLERVEWVGLPIHPSSKKTLGEKAKIRLNAFTVAVGDLAREIEGISSDGKRFSLSEYRGKVVVLTFSANWCAPCKAMYPDLRKLVDRMKGKPFALLSVSADFSVKSLEQSVEESEITWRCWWDGSEGPISESWGIEGFPSIYVIDHRGIIRFSTVEGHDLTGKALDRVAEKLVMEIF